MAQSSAGILTELDGQQVKNLSRFSALFSVFAASCALVSAFDSKHRNLFIGMSGLFWIISSFLVWFAVELTPDKKEV